MSPLHSLRGRKKKEEGRRKKEDLEITSRVQRQNPDVAMYSLLLINYT